MQNPSLFYREHCTEPPSRTSHTGVPGDRARLEGICGASVGWVFGFTSSWRTKATSESYMMTQPNQLQSHSAPSLRLSSAWKLTASSRELPLLGCLLCSAPALDAPFAMLSLFASASGDRPALLPAARISFPAHSPSPLCSLNFWLLLKLTSAFVANCAEDS